MNLELLLESRRVWGVTEIARALGRKPTVVRQWVYRQKDRSIYWGYPDGFPVPDERIGGRPVWLAESINWWLGLHARMELFPQVKPDEIYDPNLRPTDFDRDDTRRDAEGVLREDSPLLAGRHAFRAAKRAVAPPLIVALVIYAAEHDWRGGAEFDLLSDLAREADSRPHDGHVLLDGVDQLKEAYRELWPW